MAEAQHRAEGAEARAEAAAEAAREETSRARADTERERDQLTHAHQAQATALETRITELATERDTAMRQGQEELALARADAEREREELRAALDARVAVLEDARADLRARAEHEADILRAQLTPAAQDPPGPAPAVPAAGPPRHRHHRRLSHACHRGQHRPRARLIPLESGPAPPAPERRPR